MQATKQEIVSCNAIGYAHTIDAKNRVICVRVPVSVWRTLPPHAGTRIVDALPIATVAALARLRSTL